MCRHHRSFSLPQCRIVRLIRPRTQTDSVCRHSRALDTRRVWMLSETKPAMPKGAVNGGCRPPPKDNFICNLKCKQTSNRLIYIVFYCISTCPVHHRAARKVPLASAVNDWSSMQMPFCAPLEQIFPFPLAAIGFAVLIRPINITSHHYGTRSQVDIQVPLPLGNRCALRQTRAQVNLDPRLMIHVAPLPIFWRAFEAEALLSKQWLSPVTDRTNCRVLNCCLFTWRPSMTLEQWSVHGKCSLQCNPL